MDEKTQVESCRGLTECPCCGTAPLHCPFCGSPGMIRAENYVGCSNHQCDAGVDFGHWCGEENGIPAVHWVIKQWNTRIDPSARLAAAEAVCRAAETVVDLVPERSAKTPVNDLRKALAAWEAVCKD